MSWWKSVNVYQHYCYTHCCWYNHCCFTTVSSLKGSTFYTTLYLRNIWQTWNKWRTWYRDISVLLNATRSVVLLCAISQSELLGLDHVHISLTIYGRSVKCVGRVNSLITFQDAPQFSYSLGGTCYMFTILIPCKAGMLCFIISMANDSPQAHRLTPTALTHLAFRTVSFHLLAGQNVEISTDDMQHYCEAYKQYLSS
jgi:hypothetical protein